MRFINENFVCSAILHENGTHGMKMEWNCIPNKSYKVEGFLICYTTGESTESCRKIVEAMNEKELLNIVRSNGWVYSKREDLDNRVAALSLQDMSKGFAVLNSMFKAPCKIEVWTAATSQTDGSLCIMNRAKSDTVCFRRLFLRKEVKLGMIPAVKGGLFGKKIITPARPVAEIRVTSTDPSALYRDGAVGYFLPGNRFMFPLAKETLGQTLRFEDVNNIDVVINKEYSKMYEFIN